MTWHAYRVLRDVTSKVRVLPPKSNTLIFLESWSRVGDACKQALGRLGQVWAPGRFRAEWVLLPEELDQHKTTHTHPLVFRALGTLEWYGKKSGGP